MTDWNALPLYTTEPDTCIIGCGTPLIFLRWVPREELLFCCPSCEGIFARDLFLSNNPRLYSADEFDEATVTLATENEIPKIWRGRIIAQENDEKKYYLDVLIKMFGGRLILTGKTGHSGLFFPPFPGES
jgi:hypothetical protein